MIRAGVPQHPPPPYFPSQFGLIPAQPLEESGLQALGSASTRQARSHTCKSSESGQPLASVSQAAIMSAVPNWLPHKRAPACPVSLVPWWVDTLSFLDPPTWARPGVSLRTPRQTSLYAPWRRKFSQCAFLKRGEIKAYLAVLGGAWLRGLLSWWQTWL